MFLAWLFADASEAASRAEREFQAALSDGWRGATTAPGLRIAVGDARAPQVRAIGDGFVVGELFRRCAPMNDAPEVLAGGRESAEGVARHLLSRYWGRYVALLRAPGGSDWSVLRDPSGASEALVWRSGALWRVASTLRLPAALRPEARVDWSLLAGVLADPARVSASLALSGLSALTPGELRPLDRSGTVGRQLWSPARLAKGEVDDPHRARARVRDAVAASVRASERPLAEVSGGFDSSVVAALLCETRGPQDVAWVHHAVGEAEADERSYARATARRLRLPLTERLKCDAGLDPADLLRLGDLARPSLNATDVEYEAAMVANLRASGSDGFVTGQGGDAVFLTLRSAWTADDLLHRRGVRAVADEELWGMARSARTSIWTCLRRAALSRARWAKPALSVANAFASADVRRQARSGAAHPWLDGIADLPAGKQLQVAALTEALVVQSECVRSRAAPLIHPLLSQPVLELCLPVPADILVHGGRDRGWAREVFAGDLAPEVAQRRAKSDMTAYYGRMLASSLTELRPFLLEGQLTRHGLLDQARLARALDVDALAVSGLYADLMDLVAVEAWSRAWSR